MAVLQSSFSSEYKNKNENIIEVAIVSSAAQNPL